MGQQLDVHDHVPSFPKLTSLDESLSHTAGSSTLLGNKYINICYYIKNTLQIYKYIIQCII